MFVALPGIVFKAAGGGCPSAGTILDTLYNQTFPIADGGEYVEINSVNYPSQKATVNLIADGSCGTTLDWANAVDITYFPADTDTGLAVIDVNGKTEVPTGADLYYDNGTLIGYTWNGSGGTNYPVTKGSYFASDTDTNLTGLDVSNNTEVPTGSGLLFFSGTKTGYTWDGVGGYNYPVLKGSYYPYGTFIYNDDPNPYYYWDGVGGYYAEYI